MISNIFLDSTSADFDIIGALWRLGPAFALMGIAIAYLVYQIDKKEKNVQELNLYIRDNDKENLEVLNSINGTLDKLIQSLVTGNENLKEKIIAEANSLKSHVDIKVAELKNHITEAKND